MLFAMNCIKKLHEIGGKSDIPLRLYIEVKILNREGAVVVNTLCLQAALVTDSIPFEDSPSIVYEFLSKVSPPSPSLPYSHPSLFLPPSPFSIHERNRDWFIQ